MMQRAVPTVVLLVIAASSRIPAAATSTPPFATSCAELAAMTMPNVVITEAREIPAGPYSPTPGGRAIVVPAFCRVAATAAPTADSAIAIEVWIPSGETWNGTLLGTANGGFGGAIGYPAMAAGLLRGYATVGTDTGHTGDQLNFGNGHPEKIIDWAYRSIHVMTDAAKLFIRSARGRFPARAYFDGCSTGGQQALSEAQRFPQDYDGIIAGDPGHNRIRLILGFLWSWMALHDDEGRPLLPAAKLPALTAAAVQACDATDGLRDGLIADPRACRFDPATIACREGDNASCLTPVQVTAVQKVYDGASNALTKKQLFPGWTRGSEQGWGTYLLNPPEPSRVGFFRIFGFNDPAWHWRTFDWDRDVAFVDSRLPFLSATSTDLTAFKANGGKLIMYTGLADPVVPAQDTVNYYEDVVRATGGLRQTQSFFRFFPVPGMGHCSGGPGPNTFDALAALEQWREYGVAPEVLTASHSTNGTVDRTRPVCAYPKTARYLGKGSVDAAESFVCALPPATAPRAQVR
jgi:tannase/feruloyl esterase